MAADEETSTAASSNASSVTFFAYSCSTSRSVSSAFLWLSTAGRTRKARWANGAEILNMGSKVIEFTGLEPSFFWRAEVADPSVPSVQEIAEHCNTHLSARGSAEMSHRKTTGERMLLEVHFDFAFVGTDGARGTGAALENGSGHEIHGSIRREEGGGVLEGHRVRTRRHCGRVRPRTRYHDGVCERPPEVAGTWWDPVQWEVVPAVAWSREQQDLSSSKSV